VVSTSLATGLHMPYVGLWVGVLAMVLGLSGPASAASPQASCQALVNSSFAGQPGARAAELRNAFEEAAECGVPAGAVLSEFVRVHGGSIEGCFVD
jgi:hypothetical protein